MHLRLSQTLVTIQICTPSNKAISVLLESFLASGGGAHRSSRCSLVGVEEKLNSMSSEHDTQEERESIFPAHLQSLSGSSSSTEKADSSATSLSGMKCLAPTLLKLVDDILRPRTAMDIFVYTLPDRIKKVFTTLYMEVDRLLVQFQQFSSYLSRGNSISYKEFDKTHQYHKDFLTELLTCIEDMMNYIDSMTVTVDPEGVNILTPLTNLLKALIQHYDETVE